MVILNSKEQVIVNKFITSVVIFSVGIFLKLLLAQADRTRIIKDKTYENSIENVLANMLDLTHTASSFLGYLLIFVSIVIFLEACISVNDNKSTHNSHKAKNKPKIKIELEVKKTVQKSLVSEAESKGKPSIESNPILQEIENIISDIEKAMNINNLNLHLDMSVFNHFKILKEHFLKEKELLKIQFDLNQIDNELNIETKLKEYLDIFVKEKNKIKNNIQHQIELIEKSNIKELNLILKVLNDYEKGI